MVDDPFEDWEEEEVTDFISGYVSVLAGGSERLHIVRDSDGDCVIVANRHPIGFSIPKPPPKTVKRQPRKKKAVKKATAAKGGTRRSTGKKPKAVSKPLRKARGGRK